MMFMRQPLRVSDAAASLLRACAAGSGGCDALRAAAGRLPPDAAEVLPSDSGLSSERSCGSLAAIDAAAPRPVHAQHAVLPQQRRLSTASAQSQPSLVPGPATTGDRRRIVAVGISGGVDSAVAALMLQQAGHDVVGVFMRNWDERDESGDGCSAEEDFREAQQVARFLGIALHEADFVAEYWTRVFDDFVQLTSRGLTPNPDLACNRHIKFDALLRFSNAMGADCVATGHYARLRHDPEGGPSQLLTGADPLKDQSYFLASVPGAALRDVLFPLGALRKADVRRAAAEAGIPSAHRRSSAGLCFVGRRRRFGDFLAQYAPPLEGRYLDIDDPERSLGPCPNMIALTHGQRAGIGGAVDRMYVVGKDMPARTVLVAAGRDHAALYTRSALLSGASWVAGGPPAQLVQGGSMAVTYKARYGQPAAACTVSASQRAGHSADLSSCSQQSSEFVGSQYWRPLSSSSTATTEEPDELRVALPDPARAITPQQEFVMYDGEVCLGAAPVAAPGMSLHELGEALPPGYVFRDSIHEVSHTQQPAVSSPQWRRTLGHPIHAQPAKPPWVQAVQSAQARLSTSS